MPDHIDIRNLHRRVSEACGAPSDPESLSAIIARRMRVSRLAALAALDCSQGQAPLVSLREWRAEAERAGLVGKAFDAAAWALVDSGAVILTHHDYPAGMSPEERAACLFDGHFHFNAAAVAG